MDNNKKTGFSRRDFIKGTSASCIVFSLPGSVSSAFKNSNEKIKIGLITDLHHDTMHDGLERMQAFLDVAKKEQPDALFQLGDFAYPGDKNKTIIDLYNNAHKTALHVIGNHDMDSGYTREQCVSYWGMPARYYVKEIKGIHFIFLDGNEKGSPTHKGGYAAYIGEEQWLWLKKQLKTIQGPIVIVSHQPIVGRLAIDNAEEIQDILATASDKILFAINGHTHINMLLKTKGITYVHLNSASYLWAGGKYKHQSYSQQIHKEHPWIQYTCPYKDSLFSFMTIDPKTLSVNLSGKQSEWVGTPPNELGLTNYPTLTFGEELVPHISVRKILRVKKQK
ncbi:MAG: metallophosphoesterase family protein [Polaribacter sp.]